MPSPQLFDPRTGAALVPGTVARVNKPLAASDPFKLLKPNYILSIAEKMRHENALRGMSGELKKPVLCAISSRLASFSPSICLADHIESDLKVFPVLGEGISFRPRDSQRLTEALQAARTSDNERVFADKDTDFDHFPFQLSLAATDGFGLREIRGAIAPPRYAGGVPSLDRDFDVGQWRVFSANFGVELQIDLLSLHFAISKNLCTVHIDNTGFLLRAADGSFSLTANGLQHTVNELIWKTYGKALLPKRLKFIADRVSLVLPNSANGFSRWGPTVGQTGHALKSGARYAGAVTNAAVGVSPGARKVTHTVGKVVGPVGDAIGEIGGVVNELPGIANLNLPGLSIDVIQRKKRECAGEFDMRER